MMFKEEDLKNIVEKKVKYNVKQKIKGNEPSGSVERLKSLSFPEEFHTLCKHEQNYIIRNSS